MSALNADDELDCPINLSRTRPDVQTKNTNKVAGKNVPVAGTSMSSDNVQNVVADASKKTEIILLPKKRPYVIPETPTEQNIRHEVEIAPKQPIKLVISGLLNNEFRTNCATDEKSWKCGLVASDKPTVKTERQTGKKRSQKASRSELPTTQPSAAQPSTSQPSTSQPSTSQPSTLQPSTWQPSTSHVSASEPSTSQPPKARPSKSRPSMTQSSSSQASTSQASTSQASTSQPSAPQPSTSQLSASQPSTSQPSQLQSPKARPSKSRTRKSGPSKSRRSKPRKSTSRPSMSQSSKSQASTSQASTSQASSMSVGSKPSDTTSEAPSSKLTDDLFWIKTVKSKFASSDYKKYLQKSQFSERQSDVLQQAFHTLARKWSNMITNSDRFMKRHKCRDCGLTISHQCVPIYYVNNFEITTTAIIVPEATIICICPFAFFHVHTGSPKPDESTSGTQHLQECNHSVHLTCAMCETNVRVDNHQKAVCGTFSKWSDIKSVDQKQFHESLANHIIKYPKSKTLSFEEFYTCNNHCCLLFHRCLESHTEDPDIPS